MCFKGFIHSSRPKASSRLASHRGPEGTLTPLQRHEKAEERRGEERRGGEGRGGEQGRGVWRREEKRREEKRRGGEG